MGRYTLKSEVPGLEPVIIEIKEANKQKAKVNLTTIDSLTLGSCPLAVLKKIDFDNAKLVSMGHFYISYISKQTEKRLRVLFNDAHGLKSIALEGNTEIRMDNRAFNEFIDKVFLPLTNDYKFMNFLRDNNFISLKIDEWLNNLHSKTFAQKFCIEKIKYYASSYKKFRAIVMAVELYRNPNYLIPDQVYEEERDPDLDGFYSLEEKKEYDKYMEELPDSYCAYEKRI